MNKPEILFTNPRWPENLKGTVSPAPSKQQNTAISLASLLVIIWSGKKLISILALGLFIVSSVFFSSRFYSPGSNQYHTVQLQFTFAGAEKGLYPNGTQFNFSDITSAQVLKSVYNKYPLINQQLSLEQFMGKFIIHPAVIQRSAIEARYRDELNSGQLSQTEISALEKTYKTELSTRSQRSASLSYLSNSPEPLERELIEKILIDIPLIWSRLAINQSGALDLPIISQSSMDLARLNSQEYEIGLALIHDYKKLLKNSLSILNQNQNAELILDPETGLSLRDLNNQLDRFETYQLNTLDKLVTNQHAFKDLKITKAFLLSKLQSLQDRLRNIRHKADIYKAAYQEHSQLSDNFRANFQPLSGTNTELGDAFVSQLVKLGKKISESKFRQQLIDQQITLTLKAEDLKAEITLLKRKLSGLNEHKVNSSAQININDLYLKAINKFIEISNHYTKLTTIAKFHNLSGRDSLFELLENEAITTSMNLIQFQRTATAGLVALLVGAMFGVLIVLVRELVIDRSS